MKICLLWKDKRKTRKLIEEDERRRRDTAKFFNRYKEILEDMIQLTLLTSKFIEIRT